MSLFGGANADYWEPIRRSLIPRLDTILRKYGGYAEHPAWQKEYACTVKRPAEEMEVVLEENWGFGRNPIASLKHTDQDVTELSSWRRLYAEQADGTIVDGGLYSKWQLHIRLFPHTCSEACPEACKDASNDASVDLFVHWELNPFYDPWAHYKGNKWDVSEGKTRTMEFVSGEFDDTEYFQKF